MKLSPYEQERAKLFGPSKFSRDGFLGHDSRHPDEIITADMEQIDRLGTTNETIADLLSDAFDKAERALGDPVVVQPGVSAVYFEARGKVPSPFRGDGTFQKGEVVVTDAKNGKSIVITRLGINLIRKHAFFQGRGSRYRIEPEDVLLMCPKN